MSREEVATSSQNVLGLEYSECNNAVEPYFGSRGINNLCEDTERSGCPGLGDAAIGAALPPHRVPGLGQPNYNTLLRIPRIKWEKRSRGKLFSRSLIGMLVPGKYLFVTWSSLKDSPSIEKSWVRLREWLKRHYPAWEWVYCLTDEHYGVVHMIVRLGEGEDKPVIDAPGGLRDFWIKLHGSPWVNVQEVKNEKGLADYIADQRRRKGMATEMYSQVRDEHTILRWRMGQAWVPVGFMKAFGRFYFRYSKVLNDLAMQELVRDWLIDCRKDVERVKFPPWVKGNVCHWSDENMSKPLIKLFMGGSVKFVAPGDTYKDPSGTEKIYDKAKVMISLAGAKQSYEISKFALDAVIENMKDPVVAEKMKGWGSD